jgi:hypothetical protein
MSCRLFVLVLVLVWALVRGMLGVHAQHSNADVLWDAPVNLSNTRSSSTRPAIAADPWGQVHVFWSEKEGGKPIEPGGTPEVGDTIYYRRLAAQSWSDPISLFFTSASGDYCANPAVAVDSVGNLHLIWVGWNGVYYSRSSALDAPSARSWQRESLVVEESSVDEAEIAIGLAGDMYIVYNRLREQDPHVYFLRSDDKGRTWTTPKRVSTLYSSEAKFTFRPRIVVDWEGRLHVTWIEHTGPPNYLGLALYLVTSEDQGETWGKESNLTEAVAVPTEQVWEGFPIVIDADSLLLVSIVGPQPARHYRLSTDGGNTWTPAQHIFGELVSRAGWDAMTVDGAGTVHLIAQLRFPEGLYASHWTASGWRDPPQSVILDPPLNKAHYPQMVISEGNQIHVVVEEHPTGEIWYIHGVAQAPHLPAPPRPTATPLATPGVTRAPEPTEPATAEPVASAPTRALGEGVADAASDSSIPPVVMAVVSTILVMGAVVAARLLGKGRR